MTPQQDAAASAAHATGTQDKTYNLVSVLYHALQGAKTARQSIQDAQHDGDEELMQFFRAAQAWQRHLATQAKELLKQRLSERERREWAPGANLWNLKIIASPWDVLAGGPVGRGAARPATGLRAHRGAAAAAQGLLAGGT